MSAGQPPDPGATASDAPHPAPDAPPERAAPHLEAASPDVVLPGAGATLPGEHRGGFATPPTAPVVMAVAEHPSDPAPPRAPGPLPAPWRPGAYALAFAIVGLAASILVGWAFPLGLVGLALGVVAVRRPDQRTAGVWAIALAAASLLYSAGWLVYALPLL